MRAGVLLRRVYRDRRLENADRSRDADRLFPGLSGYRYTAKKTNEVEVKLMSNTMKKLSKS